MQLVRLDYEDHTWELRGLELGLLNLIVGKNSVGKSRTLSRIGLLAQIITQKKELREGGNWSVEFNENEGDLLNYQFSSSLGKGLVTKERITQNGEGVLVRSRLEYQTRLKNFVTNTIEAIFPPRNKLTLHTNRDVRKYPYLESIVTWAECTYGFKFGNLAPYSRLSEQDYGLLAAIEDTPKQFETLSENSHDRIVSNLNALGYQVEEIFAEQRGDIVLFIQEKSLDKPIPHYRLSQGMFRSLALLIFLEFLGEKKRPATLT
jgi:predicted ATPase